MRTVVTDMMLDDRTKASIRIGALAPLSPPGWVEAGRHLLAGLQLGADEINAGGGIDGKPIELIVRDTAADPAKATAALGEFAALGVAAVAGEYHSVVARAAAAQADALAIPYLCSSAVLDALTEKDSKWVARLAPAQSRGWRIYADFLLDSGHRHIAVASQPSIYWASGIRILRDHLAAVGGNVIELDLRSLSPSAVCDRIVESHATALLLLVGYPDPAVSVIECVRSDERLNGILIGAPAGQPEFQDWATLLGSRGDAVSFLRYLPERLSPLGDRVATALLERLGESPSFVAFEGYDSIVVLADLLKARNPPRHRPDQPWASVAVEGSRGQISFSRIPGISVWQWAWPPVQIVDRDPNTPGRFRRLI